MNEYDPDVLVPFLLDFQDEIHVLIQKKYGEQAAVEMFREKEPLVTALLPFLRILIRFSADPEIKAAIERRYRECGKILKVFSKNHSNTGIFLDTLDESSRLILFTLSTNGYATLDELSQASQSTHFEVLHRLREVINPESIRRFGIPLVVFRESKTDPLTGEKIPFSWWLNEEFCHESGQVEVTEDEEQIFMTVELAGSDLPRTMRASATFNHGILEVQIKKGGKTHGRRSKGTG